MSGKKLRRFTVNKKALTARMAKDSGITGLQAEKAFTSLISGVKSSLKKGHRVTSKKKRVRFNPSKSFIDSL